MSDSSVLASREPLTVQTDVRSAGDAPERKARKAPRFPPLLPKKKGRHCLPHTLMNLSSNCFFLLQLHGRAVLVTAAAEQQGELWPCGEISARAAVHPPQRAARVERYSAASGRADASPLPRQGAAGLQLNTSGATTAAQALSSFRQVRARMRA